MPLEYEYQFYDFDKSTIIKQIKKLGFKNKGSFIFKVMVFHHPTKKPNTYTRIRDEGFRTTITFKERDPKSKFENENEIVIDNFDNGIKLLLNLGCQKKYYYEKIREIWSLNDNEIVFDINPGEQERMEIESNNEKNLDDLTKKLKLTDSIVESKYDITKEQFGFELGNITDLTFLNCKKVLSNLPTKNKSKFKELIKYQLNLYNELIN